MKAYIEERARELGKFVVNSHATIQDCSRKFGISKSTVHTDLTVRLKSIDIKLYEQVKRVLDLNKAEAHLRGGIATKEKYWDLSK